MSQQLPDVQASRPDVSVGLNRVGVTGVEKLLKLHRDGGRPIVLMAEFDVFVDLPSWRKGADMSRNMEVVDAMLEEAVSEPAVAVEDVCGDVAERLLEKHDYTTRAEVGMEAEYVIREETPETGRPTQATADLIASATATEEGTREAVGCRVDGMTVCPCSQGMSESRARDVLAGLDVDRETIDAFLEEVNYIFVGLVLEITLKMISRGKKFLHTGFYRPPVVPDVELSGVKTKDINLAN